MNVHRIHSGANAPGLQKGQMRSNIDLTISDQGVAFSRPAQAPLEPERTAGVQITSDPALQELLSAAETQALQQNFAAPTAVPEAPASAAGMSVYNGRGTRVDQTSGMQGRLVDLVG